MMSDDPVLAFFIRWGRRLVGKPDLAPVVTPEMPTIKTSPLTPTEPIYRIGIGGVGGAPIEPDPAPSCFAKGVIKAWVDDRANWVIKRSKIKTKEEIQCGMYHGSEPPKYRYRCRDVSLRYAALDLLIEVEEHEYKSWGYFSVNLRGMRVLVAGSSKINSTQGPWSLENLDYQTVHKALIDHPYPAFARLAKKCVERIELSKRLAEQVEELGCKEPNP